MFHVKHKHGRKKGGGSGVKTKKFHVKHSLLVSRETFAFIAVSLKWRCIVADIAAEQAF